MKPRWKIEANDVDITASLSKYLESLTVTDDLMERADQLEISFGRIPELPAIGLKLKCWMGYDELVLMGAFEIDEPQIDLIGHKVTVRGRSVVSSAEIRSKSRRRTWDDMATDAIVRQIAEKHGLRMRYTADIVRLPHLTQFDESDASFLRRLAVQIGAHFSIKNDTLLMLEDADNDVFEILTTVLASPSFLRSTGTAYKSARCGYYDSKTGAAGTVVSGKGDPMFEGPSGYESKAAARGAASSLLRKHKEGGVSGSLTFDRLRPDIYAGATLSLVGCNYAEFDTKYKAKQLRHTITPSSGSSAVEI